MNLCKRMFLIIVMCISMGASLLHAADSTWSAASAAAWSDAAAWSNGVPGTNDHAIFDATSIVACAIDGNISVGSLTILSAYTGVVSADNHTIEISIGNFTADAGGFDAGTGSIKFIGSTLQIFDFQDNATYYKIENAKTGGILEIPFWNSKLTLDTFKASAGTTTETGYGPHFITNIDLQGASGNLATFVSGEVSTISYWKIMGGTQNVAYASFENINVKPGGDTLIAGSTSVDAGGNTNISFSSTKTWDGGGVDSNWSTAANWSGDVLPSAIERVQFDATSVKNCTIDANTVVGGVDITNAYTGIVSAGSFTLSIADSDFNAKDGGFDAGTGTLKFTGSAHQIFDYQDNDTYYILENAKSAGELEIDFWDSKLTLDTLKAGAGTTTETGYGPHFITNIDLQGASGNLATFVSGEVSTISYWKIMGGTQNVAYASFQNINVKPGGDTLIAGSSSVDAGGNTNISFSSTKTWDGGGADANWSTAANWSGDVLPSAIERVQFDATSVKNCTIDADTVVGGVDITSAYTGTVSAGTFTLSIADSDFNAKDGGFDAGTGTLKFTGSAHQIFDYQDNDTYYILENAKTAGELEIDFWDSKLTLDTLKAGAGTTTETGYGPHFITNIDLEGTSGNLATFVSGEVSTNSFWKIMGGTQNVAYASFQNINVKPGGDTLIAGGSSVDAGGNTNIDFSGNIAPLITSVAPATAAEGIQYTYQVQVNDPDDINNGIDLQFELSNEPAGMLINETGLISWVPAEGVSASNDYESDYEFLDSDQIGGPVYVWNDISSSGVLLSISDADEDSETIVIPFDFPFYGESYSSIHVNTNGYLTVGVPGNIYHNYALPTTSSPSGLIAAWYDDLHPGFSGSIYVQTFPTYVVVQWDNVAPYYGTGGITCQAILYKSGSIQFVYDAIPDVTNTATIGVQDTNRMNGTTISFNDNYVHANLAIDLDLPIMPTTVTVNDGGEDGAQVSTELFSIAVVPVNNSPVITENAPLTATEDILYVYQLEVVDPDDDNDGTAIMYTLLDAPGSMTVNSTGLIEWTPVHNELTSDIVTIQVADGGEDGAQPDQYSFTIAVTPVNDAPTISGDPAVSVTIGSEFTFTPVGDDEENDPISYSIENRPSWATFSTVTGSLIGIPVYEDIGVDGSISISINDGVNPAVFLNNFSIYVQTPAATTTAQSPSVIVQSGSMYDDVQYIADAAYKDSYLNAVEPARLWDQADDNGSNVKLSIIGKACIRFNPLSSGEPKLLLSVQTVANKPVTFHAPDGGQFWSLDTFGDIVTSATQTIEADETGVATVDFYTIGKRKKYRVLVASPMSVGLVQFITLAD
ncbi:MAG: Ig-like domain-containing protein [Planctomycetes bacterium]|nr:Ig-like domain-containing protein [Planctomycetota bacterium]